MVVNYEIISTEGKEGHEAFKMRCCKRIMLRISRSHKDAGTGDNGERHILIKATLMAKEYLNCTHYIP